MNLQGMMRASLAIVALIASAHCAFAAPRCPSTRVVKARLRTVAWVNTTCRTEAGSLVGRQELYVQRGDRAPVIVSQAAIGPTPDPLALCRSFGGSRRGVGEVVAGAYMAVAVSPDGARVAFEVNDKFTFLGPGPRLSDDEKGLYLVGADGAGLVKLGPPTDVPAAFLTPWLSLVVQAKPLAFSRDGRYLVYVDIGQADDGSVDSQLWSIRLADRKRTQLTHLGKRHGPSNTLLDYKFSFTNDTTVGFYTTEYVYSGRLRVQELYSVAVNGKRFRKLSPVKGPNGQVLEQFGVAGGRPAAGALFLEGMPENPLFNVRQPRELFVAIGKNVLQLTDFNRSDTAFLPPVVSRSGARIVFTASANPFGCNPTNNCQVFSIDKFGGGLRQLTRLESVEHSEVGCFLNATSPGCLLELQAHEGATGTIVFNSSCDPFGTNPAGDQLFTMRPDGSGLRQITQARGVVTDTPDVVEVELPGPFAYQ